MNEDQACKLADRMATLWPEWDATPEQVEVWIEVLKPTDDPDVAWKAMQLAFAEQKGNWKKPRVGGYREALSALGGVRNPGVYGGDGGSPEASPLFVLEKNIPKAHLAHGLKPRVSTWAYPHGVPDEESLLRHARLKLQEMARLYPKAEWIIADARQPAAGASDYVKDLSWRLLNKAREAEKGGAE